MFNTQNALLNPLEDSIPSVAIPSSFDDTYASAQSTRSAIAGELTTTDDTNPTRQSTFKDDYLLRNPFNGQIKLNLASNVFDTYLQVIDYNTGSVLARNDDAGGSTNSELVFDFQADTSYIVRVTSFYEFDTGTYEISSDLLSMSPSGDSSFSRIYGYGAVDAAAAVARAIGRSPFSDVRNYYDANWGVDGVNAPEVWARGFTGEGVVVAVIDSGVDFTHADLNDNIWVNSGEIFGNGIDDDRNGYIDDAIGWDFVDFDYNPMDFNGHGTHVAGTIAAERNRFGVTGIAYDAQIMPIRVLDSSGHGTHRNIAEGIYYAANNGADVINLSLGGSYSEEVAAAVRYATQRGAVVVMAAGNESELAPGYPGHLATDWGIVVGAIDEYGDIADFSNWAGTDPAMRYVVAPGVDIYSTMPDNDYGFMNGTSMAAPHVAGVVALMLSANPNLTPGQVRQIITQTAVA